MPAQISRLLQEIRQHSVWVPVDFLFFSPDFVILLSRKITLHSPHPLSTTHRLLGNNPYAIVQKIQTTFEEIVHDVGR